MLCGCGCGSETSLVKLTDSRRGIKAGESRRFLPGHGTRLRRSIDGLSWEKVSREYHAYFSARDRCENPKSRSWKNYGGRGIEFRFGSFEEFYRHIGPKPDGYTLDRINNDGHYEIGNVRWATWSENLCNRRRNKRKRGYKLTPQHIRNSVEGRRIARTQRVAAWGRQ